MQIVPPELRPLLRQWGGVSLHASIPLALRIGPTGTVWQREHHLALRRRRVHQPEPAVADVHEAAGPAGDHSHRVAVERDCGDRIRGLTPPARHEFDYRGLVCHLLIFADGIAEAAIEYRAGVGQLETLVVPLGVFHPFVRFAFADRRSWRPLVDVDRCNDRRSRFGCVCRVKG